MDNSFLNNSKQKSIAKSTGFDKLGDCCKKLLVYLGVTMICAAAYSSFLNISWLGLVLIIMVSTASSMTLHLYRSRSRKSSYDRQFLWLIEYVSTAMTTGTTLENSLMKAADDIAELRGDKYRELKRALAKLQSGLSIHLDLDRSLHTFVNEYPCDSARQILGNISWLRRSGGKLDQYIQNSTRMLREKLELKRSMEAELSGKATEAFIVTLTPFFMAFVLKYTGNFHQHLYDTGWGIYAMAAVYIISCFSFLLALLIKSSTYDSYKMADSDSLTRLLLTHTSNRAFQKNKSTGRTKQIFLKCAHKIRCFYKDYLPDHVWQRIQNQLKTDAKIFSLDQKTAEIGYFLSKLVVICIAILTLLLLSLFEIKMLPLFVLLPFIPVLQDLFLLRRFSLRSSQENMRYPQWLNLLSILLVSGLSLQKALQISCHSNIKGLAQNTNEGADYFEQELMEIRLQLGKGITPSVILSQLSGRCTIFQIKYVLDLFIRYERDGGKEILDIITLGTSSSWQIYRDELKKKLQTKNLLYLLPSGLSLLAVIATALIPAVSMLMF